MSSIEVVYLQRLKWRFESLFMGAITMNIIAKATNMQGWLRTGLLLVELSSFVLWHQSCCLHMEDLPPSLHLYCQPLHLESYKYKFYAKCPVDFKPMRLIPANLINSCVSFIQRVQDWGAKGPSSCAPSCECCQGQLAPLRLKCWHSRVHTWMQFSFFLSLVLKRTLVDLAFFTDCAGFSSFRGSNSLPWISFFNLQFFSDGKTRVTTCVTL